MKRNLSVGVLVVIASVGVAVYFIQFKHDQHSEPRPSLESIDSAGQQPEHLGDSKQSRGASPRLVEVTKSVEIVASNEKSNSELDDPYTDPNQITVENILDFAKHNLEKGLNGDFRSGRLVIEARERCAAAAKTEDELELRVLQKVNFARKIEESGQLFSASKNAGVSQVFPTFEQNVAHQERWYLACKQLNRLFTRDLRDKLDDLAQRGDVTARYIYAMWPPDVLNGPDTFFIQLDWKAKAMQYSIQNLEAGEVAGLLAFGNTYFHSLFTPRNMYLGYAFFKTAIDCD